MAYRDIREDSEISFKRAWKTWQKIVAHGEQQGNSMRKQSYWRRKYKPDLKTEGVEQTRVDFLLHSLSLAMTVRHTDIDCLYQKLLNKPIFVSSRKQSFPIRLVKRKVLVYSRRICHVYHIIPVMTQTLRLFSRSEIICGILLLFCECSKTVVPY